MNNKDIEWRGKKLKLIREEINRGQLNALRELLPNKVIEDACLENEYLFRRRLLPPEVTVFHMIGAALSAENSFQSAWHLSGQTGRSARLAEARKRLPLNVWKKLQSWTLQQIEAHEYGDLRWRGHRVIGVDGTSISMSDVPELAECFGRQKSQHGYGRFPTAKVVVAFNLKSLIHVGQVIGSCKQGENSLFVPLRKSLQKGDVLILDRYYSGANLYWNYRQEGFEFIARIHPRLIMERLKVVKTYTEHDKLVEMPTNFQLRKNNPQLPKTLVVRMVQANANIRGKRKSFWIATSLLNAQTYPAQEICDWYKRRWKIETLIGEAKEALGVAILRSKSLQGIYKELQARLLALNLIHWLILKSSKLHGQRADDISVTSTIRLTVAYSLKMSAAATFQLPYLYEQLILRIASSKLYIRPNRIEPRMIKREHSIYPRLRIPRGQWRGLLAASP